MPPWLLVISTLVLLVWGKFSFSGPNVYSSLTWKKSFMVFVDLAPNNSFQKISKFFKS